MTDAKPLVPNAAHKDENLQIFPCPPLLSSQKLGWDGIYIQYDQQPAWETPEHSPTHHTVVVHHFPNREVYVLGNESQLYRLVSNLIANAIQYTPSGGHVVISLTARDRTAFISVKDTGIGIAPAEQTRIFERFYRVDSDRSRKTGGTGLGLAIVQAISQVHQGSIQVQSELGQGTIFTLRLPLM